MGEFRRTTTGAAVTKATLHTGNTGIFYHKGDDKGKKKITVTTSNDPVVGVEAVKMNSDKDSLRQVRLAAKKAGGPVSIKAMDGTTVIGELTVTVEDKLTLPDKNQTEGMVARLLIAESKTPYHKSYDAVKSRKGMEWMLLVLHNRLNNNPKFFNADGAKTLLDIVKGKGQFAGFGNYPNLSSEMDALIQSAVDNANDDNHGKQDQYIVFVKNALEVAAKKTPVADPASPDLLGYWRTAGSGKPESSAVIQDTLVGNTFYKTKKP
jgi:hypothetical protein